VTTPATTHCRRFAMEVNHHLQWAVTRPEALFELELSAFAHQLGVVPDANR
jgi:hypothetical protein